MMQEQNNSVKKTIDGLTKNLPKLVKDNKGAAIGAVVGYLLADKISENQNVITALLGGLVGHVVDEKSKGRKSI